LPRKKTFDELETLRKIGHLFWRNGYGATGVDLISDHVSLKKTSVYNAYGDKASLFLNTLDWYADEILQGGIAVLKGEAPVSDEISTLLRNSLVLLPADMASQGCLLLNSLVELKHTEPDLFEHARCHAKRLPEAVESYLLEAREAGRIAPETDARDLTGYIMAILQGVQVQSRSHTSDANIDNIISMALKPIKELERLPKNKKSKVSR